MPSRGTSNGQIGHGRMKLCRPLPELHFSVAWGIRVHGPLHERARAIRVYGLPAPSTVYTFVHTIHMCHSDVILYYCGESNRIHIDYSSTREMKKAEE